MHDRSRKKRPTDLNKLASEIVSAATQGEKDPDSDKNPSAVALGRLGGKKGGVARAKALTPAKRREIAKKAANARWNKQRK